jgi:uncharacterized protein
LSYLVIIYDYKDVLDLRLKYRPKHLESLSKFILDSVVLNAGAILKDADMIGSSMIVNFNCIDDLRSWLSNDPYVKGNVWNLQTLQIIPLKLLDK